ncbi:choline-binding transcriptional repressor BetI [Limimaricola pyoseonensis]|uniref:HTH-type transcriptional regulator BetI n=1 Tax=Limimaricola pyoseonensis TaxID=521013 RepID=A0A1G7CZL8_9RHOB|nr:transcriptional regulator BetI [Limimaricola pyoseonensis]SDE44683.1 transcriptional regulator, TetR family [Limimaricola pyoseonensis]
MPKLGMEPIRRAALVKATIEEIGVQGSLDVTVAQIARRAGMSSALAHHYFGNKDQIFLAAMRYLLAVYSAEVREALVAARGDPRARVAAILRTNFAPSNFRPEVVAAWMNFYVLARTSPRAARLLRIYHARLRSNLAHDLRPLLGRGAGDAAERLAALIDGLYLKQGLTGGAPDGPGAVRQLLAALELELK